MENTNTIFCPFKSSSHRRPTYKSSSMFLCVCRTGRETWIAASRKDDEAAAASLRFPVTKSFLGQTGSRDPLVKPVSTLAAVASDSV